MKIERINENQIRCTLSNFDLSVRNVNLNELAYGSEKARNLFREMIQRASREVGFEAEDIPLMVEAIPMANDSVMLIITKIEDPEELDTRFSKFSAADEDDDPSVGNLTAELLDGADALLSLLGSQNPGQGEGAKAAPAVSDKNAQAQKAAKGDKKFLHEADVFKALAEHLNGGKSARTFDCSDDDKALISTSDLLTLKPIIYAANMDEDGFANQEGNEYLKKVRALAEAEGSEVLPICAKLEQDIAELEGEEKQMFLDELGIAESGLDRLIKCSYSLLGLISFLTYGKDECRAWTIKKGTKAPQAAGKIHSDIERGFIRAEVIAYGDMIKYGSVNAAKEKGQLRSEGKEYVVQDGDMVYFRFNV